MTISEAELLDHPTPWRVVEDGHIRLLRRAVLDRLFEEAVKLRMCNDTYDDRRLFYALAFHSATTQFGKKSRTQNPRVAVLRANLAAKRRHFCSDQAWTWAAEQCRAEAIHREAVEVNWQ